MSKKEQEIVTTRIPPPGPPPRCLNFFCNKPLRFVIGDDWEREYDCDSCGRFHYAYPGGDGEWRLAGRLR